MMKILHQIPLILIPIFNRPRADESHMWDHPQLPDINPNIGLKTPCCLGTGRFVKWLVVCEIQFEGTVLKLLLPLLDLK